MYDLHLCSAMEEMARRSPEHLNWKMPLGGGHAPLHIAAIKNSYSVVEFLCRHVSLMTKISMSYLGSCVLSGVM